MKKRERVDLLIIDPQNDFTEGSLAVPGAKEDMQRLAKMIDRIGDKVEKIHLTMDSHHLIDISHPLWWEDEKGNQPEPFTIISSDEVAQGKWRARRKDLRDRSENYVKSLDSGGKYSLCIWPPHCLMGTWGHNVEENLNEALQRWAGKQFATINYVTKGSNPFTEHYGGLMAEVPDSSDPSTGMNKNLLDVLQQADVIIVAGEALSHCVKETVTQIAENIGEEHIKKFFILEDCSSPVPAIPGVDFPAIAKQWLQEMEQRGVKITTSVEILQV